jgi:hypothetical protein
MEVWYFISCAVHNSVMEALQTTLFIHEFSKIDSERQRYYNKEQAYRILAAQSPVVPISSHKQVKLMPKVQSFLENVSRNSKYSAGVYGTGLVYFSSFLAQKGLGHTPESILEPLRKNEINVYELFEGFVDFLVSTGLSIPTIRLHVAAIRSYLAYHDIDVIPSKFKRKVRMPKLYREDEVPIDAEDIRKILLACNNRRMKAYLLVLASGAMRAIEALAIRLRDCDFSVKPSKVHIRTLLY